jgi:hypothetical protein
VISAFVYCYNERGLHEMVPWSPQEWNGEGFLKPSRNNEALTTPFGFPRTEGMPSV